MLKANLTKILMIYVEPTPYIQGLIAAIELTKKDQIQVLFLSKNKSQHWDIELDQRWMILPERLNAKIAFITRLFFKNKYDIIHIAGWGHFLFLLFIAIAKIIRVPIVVESDTPLPHYNTKLMKRIFKRIFYPKLFKLVNLFFPGGKRQAKYLEYYGVNSKRIIPVQMTVDVSGMKTYAKTLTINDRQRFRERYKIRENDVVFLFVCRLVAHKGLSDLIEAFTQIKNKNTILLIVGDGDMRNSIENIVASHEKIHYAGRLFETELIKAYYSCDVLVLPSHFEPWGLVVNEAMALGKPVIVSDRVGCIDDLIVHQKNGLIVQAENVAELRKAIEYMTDASQERMAMGIESAKIIADWTLENEADKIAQAWNCLICA